MSPGLKARSARMHQTESQEKIFALLSAPATHGGVSVRRIDTHAAAVFLAGERVYKVKRAVKFPFLDYSTIERRKAACACLSCALRESISVGRLPFLVSSRFARA